MTAARPAQLRSAQRRELLVTTASRHMIERGFEGFSVNTLAEDVGMSVGGMYRYIKTKSDLLVMACEDIYGGLREQLAEVTTGENPLPDRLRAAIELYLRSCLTHQDQILLTYREYRGICPATPSAGTWTVRKASPGFSLTSSRLASAGASSAQAPPPRCSPRTSSSSGTCLRSRPGPCATRSPRWTSYASTPS